MTTSRSRAREIAARLSSSLTGFLEGRVSEEQLVKRLRKLALDIESAPVLKPPAPAQSAEEAALVQRVFEHWQRRMVQPKAKLTTGRRDKVRARLKDGYTERQMRAAIDAVAASPFHMGENDRGQKYNDLAFVLRNGETLERFAGMAREQDPQHDESMEARALRRAAEDALKKGDMDAYNSANARLRDVAASAAR